MHAVCKRHLAARVYELTKYLRLRDVDDANTSKSTNHDTCEFSFHERVFRVNGNRLFVPDVQQNSWIDLGKFTGLMVSDKVGNWRKVLAEISSVNFEIC